MQTKTTGDRIRELRKRLGISQARLGQLAGVSKQAVSSWERDVARPERDALILLARAKRVSPEWVTHGKGEMFQALDQVSELAAAYSATADYTARIESLPPPLRQIVVRQLESFEQLLQLCPSLGSEATLKRYLAQSGADDSLRE